MFSTSQTWVKNVYSLWVTGGVTGAHLYTPSTAYQLLPTTLRVQPTVITTFLNSFTPYSYTAIFSDLTDINYHLSPLSTAPTIKKNKKK